MSKAIEWRLMLSIFLCRRTNRMANVMNWGLLVIAFIGCVASVYSTSSSDSKSETDSSHRVKRSFFDTGSNRYWDAPRGEKRSFFDTNRYWDAPRGEKRSFFDTYSNWDVPVAEKRTIFPGKWDAEKRFWETEMNWPRGKRWWSRPSYTSDFWQTEMSWPRGKRGSGFWDGPSSDWTSRGKRYISPSCKRCLFRSDDWASCAACYRRGSLVPFYGQKKRSSSAEAGSVGEKRSYETSFYGLEDGEGTCRCCDSELFDFSCCLTCLKKK